MAEFKMENGELVPLTEEDVLRREALALLPPPPPLPIPPEPLNLNEVSIAQAERLYSAALREAETPEKDGAATVLLELLGL